MTDRLNVSTKHWNSTSGSSPTINRTTGVPFYLWQNSPTTMLLMLLLEYHHSLLTRVMILPSLSIWNTNWLLPELTNSSLIFLNFTKNSGRLSFYPKNITNALQIKIGSLLQTSKLVIEFSLKLSSSIQPIQQRSSLKSISVLMRSSTKQVLYHIHHYILPWSKLRKSSKLWLPRRH